MEFLFGKRGDMPTTIAKPFGVATLDHKVFIADTGAPRVVVLNMVTRTFDQFGVKGRGVLRKPINVRIGPDHRLYVADTLRKQVVVFDEQGKYLGAIGDGQEFKPADVAVYGDEVYVLDIDAHDIKVYDRSAGTLKRTLGQRGSEPGSFNFPSNMVFDEEGNLFVCDSMNFRVQKLGPNGDSLLSFGGAGDTAGFFSRPRGIAVDRSGIIYVVDALTGIVQMFNAEGQPLMFFGRGGTDEGELMLPAQIFIDYDNVDDFKEFLDPDFDAEYIIFVTNQIEKNKVSVFAFGRLHEALPAAGL